MSRHTTTTADERSADPIEPDELLESSGSSSVSPEAADAASSDTDEADPASDPSLPSGAGSGAQRSRRRAQLPLAAVIVGAVVLVAGSFFWWDAERDPQLAAAAERDQVLIEATTAIETLNTLDYRDVPAGLAAWTDVTTGTMRDGIAAIDEAMQQSLAGEQKISTGQVLEAAVLRLEGDAATVVVAVEIGITDDAVPDSPETTKRNRFSADLVLTDGRWLVEDLQQVAVSLS